MKKGTGESVRRVLGRCFTLARMTALLITHVISVILHVAFFAAWFGLGLRLTGQARTALVADASAGTALVADGARTVRLMTAFVLLGYGFALVAFFTNGGFSTYTVPYHIALTLGLLLAVVHLFLVRPGWVRLQTHLGTPEAAAGRKRVAMGLGLGHLFWFVLLVLMFWNRLVAATTI